ncbi:hypothetical protein [Streptomyces erythrochromogenes]|uniref:hypothetical protein n=1 Tax=Streptomyces erythrochromogenes TaxID=285574 RepID=UPI000318B065
MTQCRETAELEDHLADGLSEMWVLTHTPTGYVVAAACLSVRLNADGIGVLHVHHLLADPTRSDDRPQELLSAWCTRWAAHRPALVREVHFHSQCPLARRRKPHPSSIGSTTHTHHDGRVVRTDRHHPNLHPSLPAMVTEQEPLTPSSAVEVNPVVPEDHGALVQFLDEADGEVQAADYPAEGAPGRSRGYKVMVDGRLAAVLTACLRPPARTRSAAQATSRREEVFYLDRLLLWDEPGCLDVLMEVSRWAAGRARHERLPYAQVRTGSRDQVSQLTDLGWRTRGVTTGTDGFTWLLELDVRHSEAISLSSHTSGAAR